jgi:hypothetical protein
MCSKRWLSTISFLVLLVLVCPFFMTWQTGQAYADSPALDLQLDAPDAIRWDIGNIKPGDSGIESVNLHNAGNVTGYLYLWITDLVDDEGANPESETGNTTNPGELSSYIYLDIINDGMTFARLSDNGYVYTDLPITLKSFPGSSDRALYIANASIEAGQTLELRWQWTLSPSAGNDIQGDTVSFSIYYSLVSDKPAPPFYPPPVAIPPPPAPSTTEGSDNTTPGPTPEPLPPPPATPEVSDIEAPETIPPIAARRYVSADGKCVINIPEGVNVMTGSGKELLNVIIDTPENIPLPPASLIFAGPVYRILCNTTDGINEGTELTRSVQLTMYFDAATMPENAEISIYSYHPGSGWVKLDCVVDPSHGWLTASVDYLDMVALLVLSKGSGTNDLAPTTPASPVTPEKGNVSGVRKMFAEASLGIALSGTVAMMVLVYVQRRRWIHPIERSE